MSGGRTDVRQLDSQLAIAAAHPSYARPSAHSPRSATLGTHRSSAACSMRARWSRPERRMAEHTTFSRICRGFAPRRPSRSSSCSRSPMRGRWLRGRTPRIGQHGDAFFSVWRLAWVAHQLKTSPRPPVRREHLLSRAAHARVLRRDAAARRRCSRRFSWAGARPLVVYNVFLLSTFVLNALAAYVLVYRLVGLVCRPACSPA